MTFWTREDILAALRIWANKHGGQPSANDWRHAGYGHLCLTTVVGMFGSWSAGLMAAGFTPQRAGRPPA